MADLGRAVLRSEGAAGTATEVLAARLEGELLDLPAMDDHEFLRDVRDGLRAHQPEPAGLGDSVERVLRAVLNRYVSGS